MADGTVGVFDESGVGTKTVDTTEVVVGGNTVERERIVLTGQAPDEIARVHDAAPGASDMALVVRPIVTAGMEADGHSATLGTTTDAAVTTNAAGTLSAKIRGLVAILADVWDSVAHKFRVDTGLTQPLTDAQLRATAVPISGTVTVTDGSGPLTVDGTVAVTDGGGSLTVDAPVGTPVFTRLSDGSAALIGQKTKAGSIPVVLASDEDALPITDNGGSLTVDGTVATTAADGSSVALGATTDTAVDTDANGTVNAHIRGLVKTTGAAADAAVTTNTTGSISAKLRGLVAILADVWDSTNHWLKTQLQAGENHIGAIGGHKTTPTSSFSRPAGGFGYSVGTIIANSATAGSVVFLSWTVARVNTGSVTINAVRLRKNDGGAAGTTSNAVFRVHFFGAQPTSTSSGDGQTFQTNVRLAGANDYLGYIDVATDQAFQVGASGTSARGQSIVVSLASGQTVYGIMEARAAYSGISSEQFFVTLEISQD